MLCIRAAEKVWNLIPGPVSQDRREKGPTIRDDLALGEEPALYHSAGKSRERKEYNVCPVIAG